MISNISISNFKSISEIDLPLADITLLIGQNRSGKSSVFQALGLLKQSDHDEITWDGYITSLKDFENVKNKINLDTEIEIGFGGRILASELLERLTGARRIAFRYDIFISKIGIEKIEYEIDSEILSHKKTITKNQGLGEGPLIKIGESEIRFASDFNLRFPFRKSGASYREGSEFRTKELENGLSQVSNLINDIFNNFIFIPTMRGFDVATYSLSDQNPESIPTGLGLTKQAEQSASSIAYNDEDARKISKIISKIIPGVRISHKLSPQKIEITSEDEHGIYNISNEGFGLNQLCFLFQQLVKAKKNSLVFIEEPEIALHPAAHSKICDALVDEIQENPKQLLITTHSEHVLMSFLDAVMEKRLYPRQLKVYYFERENGQSKFTNLKVTEKGELVGGMKGFLEADMEHLEKFMKNLKEK